jgi:predicted Zn-dependent protease
MSAASPQAAVESVLRYSRTAECIAIADAGASANLRWAGNTLTTNGVSSTRRLTVIAIDRRADGARVGVVSRSAVTTEQVTAVVEAAELAAAQAAPAEDDQPLIGPAGHDQPAGPAWDDPPAETGIGAFSQLAAELGEAFGRSGAGGRLLYGFAEHTASSTFLGTSAGLRLRHDQQDGRLELNAKAGDGTASAWAGYGTTDFADVSVLRMEADLAARLGWAARRVERPPGRYPVLLPPGALADLMVYLYWSASGRDAADGRSVFSKPGGGTRVGERLAADWLTLRSDPAVAGLECAPFVIAERPSRESSVFDNGLRLRPATWISAGTLTALTQTRHTAALTGLPVTPAAGNLILDADGGTATLEQMISGMDSGLLLTCLWYIREVDPQTLLLTGLTRDGVYLVEKGEVTGAVNNFRFNESPVALLRRITSAGASERTLPREWGDYFSRVAMPPVQVDGFNMSSVSPAS